MNTLEIGTEAQPAAPGQGVGPPNIVRVPVFPASQSGRLSISFQASGVPYFNSPDSQSQGHELRTCPFLPSKLVTIAGASGAIYCDEYTDAFVFLKQINWWQRTFFCTSRRIKNAGADVVNSWSDPQLMNGDLEVLLAVCVLRSKHNSLLRGFQMSLNTVATWSEKIMLTRRSRLLHKFEPLR